MRAKALRIFAWLFISILFFYSLCGKNRSSDPSNQPEFLHFKISLKPFNIPLDLLVGNTDVPEPLAQAHRIALEKLDQLDRCYNKWNGGSELSRFNQLPPHIPFPVSRPLKKLIDLTDEMVKITEGRFDPTIEPARALWRDRLESGQIPSVSELASLTRQTGWWRLLLNEQKVTKTGPIELNFGAIEKGYLVDEMAEELVQRGIKNFCINWGGELRAKGSRLDGSAWRMGFETPKMGRGSTDIVFIKDIALATSGNDRQTWSVDEQSYSHILDPHTLQALKSSDKRPITCTVMAKSCAQADALATAGMLFPTCEEALSWFSQLPSDQLCCVWLSDQNGTLRMPMRNHPSATIESN